MTRPTDLQFTPASVEAMMGELKDYYDADYLTQWEIEFWNLDQR